MWMKRFASPCSTAPASAMGDIFTRSSIFASHRFMRSGRVPARRA